MKKLNVIIPGTTSQSYPIFTGKGILGNIEKYFDLSKYSRIAIITDTNVEKLWLKKLSDAISYPQIAIVLPSGEKEKNIDNVKKIWEKMVNEKLDRKSLVINLGGGVIGDMGGFAASTFMRGIRFIQIPTSVTAAVDAMVGGKLGVNFKELKNYIGLFQQPIGVIIDIATFKTLPKREYLESFGEIIKHGIILDKKYLSLVTSKKPFEFSDYEMIKIVDGSNKIKAAIVEADEKEIGLRKILNFGHTIGHAIESLSLKTGHPLMHGEAVSIGMIAETKIAELSGILSKTDADKVRKIIFDSGLPTKISDIKIEDLLSRITMDKKNKKGEIKWSLINQVGNCLYDQTVDEEIVKMAIKEILK